MKLREDIIKNYIEGYNKFDIDQMVCDFDESIVFENIQNGETTLILNGLRDFRNQAEQAKIYFLRRQQKIKSFNHQIGQTEIEIDYEATLAIDLPNGLKKGDKLKLKGKSIFEFSETGKIKKLTDKS